MSNNNPRDAWLLTTEDNPFNPFTQWIEWYSEDIRLGYDTCGLVARLSSTSDSFDDDSEFQTMRDVVELNFSGKHLMVSEATFNILIETPPN